jgi:hypothetical protein
MKRRLEEGVEEVRLVDGGIGEQLEARPVRAPAWMTPSSRSGSKS